MVWGEGDDQLWGSGRGAIGGVDVCRVPLQCALVGGEGDDQLWRSGRGAIAGCRCSVLWWGGGDDQLWGSGHGAFDNTKMGFCYLGLCWYNLKKMPKPVLSMIKKKR